VERDAHDNFRYFLQHSFNQPQFVSDIITASIEVRSVKFSKGMYVFERACQSDIFVSYRIECLHILHVFLSVTTGNEFKRKNSLVGIFL
jgi:hypothetical protein